MDDEEEDIEPSSESEDEWEEIELADPEREHEKKNDIEVSRYILEIILCVKQKLNSSFISVILSILLLKHYCESRWRNRIAERGFEIVGGGRKGVGRD